jgi:hypothetical protein
MRTTCVAGVVLVALAGALAAGALTARADEGDPPSLTAWGTAPLAPATIRPHPYTLAECLALAERNFPNLWAARARLAQAHAQLDEARWTPWFQWTARSDFGVAPPLLGTAIYPQSTLESRNISNFGNLWPPPLFFGFGVSGADGPERRDEQPRDGLRLGQRRSP